MDRHSPPTRVTFISHAATEAQRRGAFPLDEGLDQVDLAVDRSAPRAQQILSGPERRVRQTAEALGLQATVTMELRDCDYGRWNGLTLEEVQSSEPDGVAAWLSDATAAPHGGESVVELVARVGRWLKEQHGVGHIVAVTHPAIIRAAVVYALDVPLQGFWRIDIAPLTLTDLRFNGRAWTLRCSSCALRSNGGSF